MSCDLRVAAANASFCAPGARIGLLPIGGQLSRLFHLMPYGRALEMLVTSRPVAAQEAHEAGFVNRLVPPGQALPVALNMAEAIAANSPAVVQAIIRGMDVALRNGADAGESYEWETGTELSRGPDAAEGVKAFLEKRAPNFADA
jgi:enoyl-CoA hydratase